MSLWSRLQGAAQRISEAFTRNRDTESELPAASEYIERWTRPAPSEREPGAYDLVPPEPKNLPPVLNVETTRDVFEKYVPEDDWDNARLNKAFDKGFGSEMGQTSSTEMRRWRAEFLQYLQDEGIDLEDFYPDWREAYEDAV